VLPVAKKIANKKGKSYLEGDLELEKQGKSGVPG